MTDHKLLTDLPYALNAAEYTNPGYRQLYEAARSARIPAVKNNRGQWTFDPADLPAIADAMGLTVQADAAA